MLDRVECGIWNALCHLDPLVMRVRISRTRPKQNNFSIVTPDEVCHLHGVLHEYKRFEDESFGRKDGDECAGILALDPVYGQQ